MDEELFDLGEGGGVAGRSPAASGSLNYVSGEPVPTTFNMRDPSSYLQMRQLARLEQAEPSTLALHVRYSTEGQPFEFSNMAQFEQFPDVEAGLVLIVEYGDLTGRHRVVADLRSGSYELPAATFAQVYALAWDPDGTQGFPFQVAATFSRAPIAMPKLFTYTGAGTVDAATTISTIPIPNYATHVDVWANGFAGGIGAANAPNLRVPQLGLYRDYTTGLWVPPWGPVLLSGDDLSTDTFDVENAGAAAVRVFVQFTLEP